MVDTESPAPANEPKIDDQLEKRIEEWRTSALRTINERIALYDPTPTHQNASPVTSSASLHARYSASHRALDVVEIPEHLLFHT